MALSLSSPRAEWVPQFRRLGASNMMQLGGPASTMMSIRSARSLDDSPSPAVSFTCRWTGPGLPPSLILAVWDSSPFSCSQLGRPSTSQRLRVQYIWICFRQSPEKIRHVAKRWTYSFHRMWPTCMTHFCCHSEVSYTMPLSTSGDSGTMVGTGAIFEILPRHLHNITVLPPWKE